MSIKITEKDLLSGLRSAVLSSITGLSDKIPVVGAPLAGKALAAIIGFFWEDPSAEGKPPPPTPEEIFNSIRSQISKLVDSKLQEARDKDFQDTLAGIQQAGALLKGATHDELLKKLPAFVLDVVKDETKFLTAVADEQSLDTMAMLVTFGSIALVALRQEYDLGYELYKDNTPERQKVKAAALAERIEKYVMAFHTAYTKLLAWRFKQFEYTESQEPEWNLIKTMVTVYWHHGAIDKASEWTYEVLPLHLTQRVIGGKESPDYITKAAQYKEAYENAMATLSRKRTEVMRKLLVDLEPLRQTVYLWSFLDPNAPLLQDLFTPDWETQQDYYLDLGAEQDLVSTNGAWRLRMQGNYDVVIYGPNGWPWRSQTDRGSGDPTCRLLVLNDGNFVACTGTPPVAYWGLPQDQRQAPLGAGQRPFRCVMRDDGIFVVRDVTDRLILALGNRGADPGLDSWDDGIHHHFTPTHPEYIGRAWVPFSSKQRMVECLQVAVNTTPQQAADLLNGTPEAKQAALAAVRAELQVQHAPADVVRMTDNLAKLLLG